MGEIKEMDEAFNPVIERVAIMLTSGKGERPQDVDLQSHMAVDNAKKQNVQDFLREVIDENRQLFAAEMPGPGGDMKHIDDVLYALAKPKWEEKMVDVEKERKEAGK